jgi:hypothetical protein
MGVKVPNTQPVAPTNSPAYTPEEAMASAEIVAAPTNKESVPVAPQGKTSVPTVKQTGSYLDNLEM